MPAEMKFALSTFASVRLLRQ